MRKNGIIYPYMVRQSGCTQHRELVKSKEKIEA